MRAAGSPAPGVQEPPRAPSPRRASHASRETTPAPAGTQLRPPAPFNGTRDRTVTIGSRVTALSVPMPSVQRAPIDTVTEVDTPERVQLSCRLAGPAQRAAAYL